MTKILLVEDDKSLREIYGVRLLAEGYDIVSAGDGEEALAMAIKERPQLIVSDVMMPKISGFDMLDILRSTTETKNIKVIMMTALSSEDQRARGQALGADKYLVKSQVGIEDVVRVVHEVLADAPIAGAPAQPFNTAPPSTPRPAAPVPPRPAPAPVAYPSARPQPNPAPSSLPQPTAPFSTPRPSSTLGERIIHPITPQGDGAQPDYSSLIDQELQAASNAAAPAQPAPPLPPNPTPPVTAPTPVAMPQPATPPANQPAVAAPNPITPTATPVTPSLTPQPTAPAPVQPQSAPISTPPPTDSTAFSFEETPRPPTPPNPLGSTPTPPPVV